MGLVGLESAPRYRELLYKLISEDLEFAPAGFILELDRPEWSFLKDEVRWQSTPNTPAAVAAQFSFVQAFNPGGSGRIVAVTGVVANKPTGTSANIALTTTIRGASFSGAVATDTRWNSPIIPTGGLSARDSVSMSSGASAAFGNDLVIAIAAVGTNIAPFNTVNFPIVLAPGTGLIVANNTLNETITLSFFGYSRQARPEELVP